MGLARIRKVIAMSLPPIATVPEIDALLAADAPVAIGVSGGKDSQAATIRTIAHLDAIGHRGPRILIHSDLQEVEWHESLPVCRRLSDRFGIELVVVARKAGGLMQRWERRWELSAQRYAAMETVTLVPCWSTPSMRFCTSELKTHVIIAELKRRFPGQVVVNVTGVRREESLARSKGAIADATAEGRVWNWRPISDWTEAQVFASIHASGLVPHQAYGEFGMSRVSCRFCIMSSLPDLRAAAAVPESHDLYRRMVALEVASTFAFQGARWLGDIAPDLLSEEARVAFASAKERAARRAAAEATISRDLLYVKGWPTFVPSVEQAELLAGVRRQVTEIVGLDNVGFLDAASLRDRYAELIALRDAKLAA